MRPWARILLFTVAFWAVWLGIAGLAAWIHGDCGAGAAEPEIAECVREKRWVGLIALATGAIPYGLIARAIARRSSGPGR